jgi:hypothetical protein
MSFLDRLLAPKVRVRIIVRVKPENCHMISNSIKTWDLPGAIRLGHAGNIDIELEGKKEAIEKKLEQLYRNPLLAASSMQIQWLPYTGKFTYITMTF